MNQQQFSYLQHQRPSSTPAGSLAGGGLLCGIPRPRTAIQSYDDYKAVAATKTVGATAASTGSAKNSKNSQRTRIPKRASSANEPLASLRNGSFRSDLYGGALLSAFGAARRGLARNPSAGALSSDAALGSSPALYRSSSSPNGLQRTHPKYDNTTSVAVTPVRERTAALQRYGHARTASARTFLSEESTSLGVGTAPASDEVASLRARVAELEAALKASQAAHAQQQQQQQHASAAGPQPRPAQQGQPQAVLPAAGQQGGRAPTVSAADAAQKGAPFNPAAVSTAWPAHPHPPLPLGDAVVHSSSPTSAPHSPRGGSNTNAAARGAPTAPPVTPAPLHTRPTKPDRSEPQPDAPASPRTPLADHEPSYRSPFSSTTSSTYSTSSPMGPTAAVPAASAPVTPDLPAAHRVAAALDGPRRRSSSGGTVAPPTKPVCVSVGVQADLPASPPAAAPPPPAPSPQLAAAAAGGGAGGRVLPMPDAPTAAAAATAAGPATAAPTAALEKQVAALSTQLRQAAATAAFLAGELAEAEGVAREAEAARRQAAARYGFCVLDTDGDGYVAADQVHAYEVFAPYPRPILDAALRQWHYASGAAGYLTPDDFLRFVSGAEERGSRRDAQRFWFGVLDGDGDGRIGRGDARAAYDAVAGSRAPGDTGFLVAFEDLWAQVCDMAGCDHAGRGFTAAELWGSKLGGGVLGLLTNHANMTLSRTTAEWGRGSWPL